MRLCLFEDAHVVDLEPICVTRPAYDLRCGLHTLAEKQRRYFQASVIDVMIRPELAVLEADDPPRAGHHPSEKDSLDATLWVNARWVPPMKSAPVMREVSPCVALVGEEVAYALLPHELAIHMEPGRTAEILDEAKRKLPNTDAQGSCVRFLWDVIDQNGEEIIADFQRTWKQQVTSGRPTHISLLGSSDDLRVDTTARIDPFVVADTTNGPVVIDRDAVIASFTRLEGPCYIGPRSQIFGANIRGGTSIGPNCRIGGEVEASIVQGNSNKYHEGFLGHSYVGEWVNIGAGTHTSDLRNDYGEVHMTIGNRIVSGDRMKVGTYFGDHTKTGLGSLLNTGTNLGCFSNVLPAGKLLPKYVPPFCWVEHGSVADRGDIEQLFATAERMMARRGEEFTPAHRFFFLSLHRRTAAIRGRAIAEAVRRRITSR